ncbi:MAG TPA: hypothetical protein VGO40_20460 [Longimicrobium sp.]|jgi:hypothetical protein|nr:hypothetical protein [Longimicrobium sp.]
MDFAKDGTSISGLEMVVLAALLVVVAVVAWQMYQRMSGRAVSDVKGLHFTRRPHDPPE